MKLLILYDSWLPEGPDASVATLRRREAVLRAALGSDAQSIVVSESVGSTADPRARSEGIVLTLSSAKFLDRVVLDGIIREFAPDAILSLGLRSALAVGQISDGPICWLDLDMDPFDPALRPTLPGSEDAQLGYPHRLLWAFDRASRISCSTAAIRRRVGDARSLRRVGGAENFAFVLDADGDLHELTAWCAAPRPTSSASRILSQDEIREVVENRTLSATALLAASKVPERARRWLTSLARHGRRKTVGAVERIAGAAQFPLLLLHAARISVTGSRRGLDSRDRGVEPIAVPPLRPTRRPRLLVVMPYRVFPPRHGGAVRLYEQIRQLAERCEIHLLRFDQRGESRIERQEMEKFCARVEFHHWVVPPRAAPFHGFVPPSAWVFADESVFWRIRRWVETEQIDVVQFECSEMGQFLGAAGRAKTILVEYDVGFRSFARRASHGISARFAASGFTNRSRRDVLRHFVYEIGACRRADQIHAMSEEDARTLARFQPDGLTRLRVVPNAIDVSRFQLEFPPQRGGEFAFLANYEHLPNLDAVHWLVDEIWPLVLAQRPDARLSIAGSRIPQSVRDLGSREGVKVVGEVQDLASFYRKHLAILVPLRAGSGTRLKILEAFASATPVISTTLGAEGLGTKDGEDVLLADDESSFARCVVRLLDDPALARRLADAGEQVVRARFDVTSAGDLAYDAIRRLAERADLESTREPEVRTSSPGCEISIVIPTFFGGPVLHRVLDAIASQQTPRTFEIVCIDSGSSEEDRSRMERVGAKRIGIDPRQFNHGATRDAGARASSGEVLVFLNQDALPSDERWLARLTEPLFDPMAPAAVQGGIEEFPEADVAGARRFFWDSGGARFHFTRESSDWIQRFGGLGFSTVNCAIRREVWQRIPFGWIPILEDKAWQRAASEREERIVAVPEARVFHTHEYGVRALVRRSVSEGLGWRWVGQRYRFLTAARDAISMPVWRDWWRGFRRRRLTTAAEWLFPVLRPMALWWGNYAAGRELRK